MAQQPALSIIAELEDAVRNGTSERRVHTLRSVTDLFLTSGERLSDEQIRVFDGVLCLLIERVETRAKAELGKRLAPIDFAPLDVIRELATDDSIEVAGEVLAHSNRISLDTLMEVASTKGQDHLMAISGRTELPEALTDVIIDRGEGRVIRHLATNAGARFSQAGYSYIVARAEADDELIAILGLRIDLPVQYLRDLLRRAKNAVRARLLAIAPPGIRQEIAGVLEDIARETPEAKRLAIAEQLVRLMKQLSELDDAAVFTFAEQGKFDEVIVALAVLNDIPSDMMVRLMEGVRCDLLLIPCRSARLNWPTVETILRKRPMQPISDETVEQAKRDFSRLSLETAQRTVRFWQLHSRIDKTPESRLPPV